MARGLLRAAVSGSALAVVGATVVDAVFMALLFPGSTTPALLINGIEALVALTVVALVRGPARHWPTPLAFVLATSAIVTVLHLLVFVPSSQPISMSFLVLTPLAVALFLPLSLRTHQIWLLTAAMAVGVFYVSPLGRAIDSREWVTLAAVLSMSSVASLLGASKLDRERRGTFQQRMTVSRLHARGLAREAQISRLNAELAQAARIDPLTGLWNRRRLNEDLAAIADRWTRYGQTHAATLVDIDRFKNYNDRFGHLAGDAALQRVATALKTSARASDLVYRFGGEEFLVLMPEQGADAATCAAERLRAAVESLGIEHPISKPSMVLTVSAGVTVLGPDGARDVDELLRQADTALYQAKRRGRNRAVAYREPAPDSRDRVSRTASAAPDEASDSTVI